MGAHIKTQNRIREIIKAKFKANRYTPTPELLVELGIDRSRWNLLVANNSSIRILEVRSFAKWLEVPEEEITVKKKGDLFIQQVKEVA